MEKVKDLTVGKQRKGKMVKKERKRTGGWVVRCR